MARRLQASQQRTERLLRHALDASDAERRRIAGDLHDGVVQELTGVSLTLAAQGRTGRSNRNRRSTHRRPSDRASSRCARSSSRSTRRTCTRRACESAIGDLLSGLRVRGIETASRRADLGDAGVPTESPALVYRVAQEALRNVVSHSAAEHVRVRARRGRRCRATRRRRRRSRVLHRHPRRPRHRRPRRPAVARRARRRARRHARRSAPRPGTGTRVEMSIPLDGRMLR